MPALCQTEKNIFFRYETLQNYFHKRYTANLSQKIEKSPKYMISKSLLLKLKSKIGLEAHFRYVHETNICEELITWFPGKLTLSHRKNDFSNSALRRLLYKYLIQPYILPLTNKKLKNKSHNLHSTCIPFCFELDFKKHIEPKKNWKINWIAT